MVLGRVGASTSMKYARFSYVGSKVKVHLLGICMRYYTTKTENFESQCLACIMNSTAPSRKEKTLEKAASHAEEQVKDESVREQRE